MGSKIILFIGGGRDRGFWGPFVIVLWMNFPIDGSDSLSKFSLIYIYMLSQKKQIFKEKELMTNKNGNHANLVEF